MAVAAYAQTPEGDTLLLDSTKVHTLPEVKVEASSILWRMSHSAQPLTLVTHAQIEGANAANLSDVVAFSPGAFVKRYGGLGGLQTVSLRGTSSQQTLLLVDGVRYQNSSDGGFDLGNIPAAAIERVEVVRGGNAALYGANSLGGVINVVTRPPGVPGLRATASSTLGSFGERGAGLNFSGGGESASWNAGVEFTGAAGAYPFSFNEYGATTTVSRDNADFSNLFARAGWKYRSDGGIELSLASQGFRSERGVPGAVVQGSREQLHARLDERDLFGVAQLSSSSGDWQWNIGASGRANALAYRDPDERLTGPAGIDNSYSRHEAAGTFRLRRVIGMNGTVEATGEGAYAELTGNSLDPSAGDHVGRTSWSGAIISGWLFPAVLFGWDLSVDAGVRGDWFSDLDPALSPSLGLVLHPAESPLRLRLYGGLNYRTPSFTEQYYLNYGNVHLRPERSKSVDLGATYQLGDGLLAESTLFLIDTRDQIVSVPRSPVNWSAANIGRVLSRGLELALSGSILERIDLHLSYTLMRAEDRSGGVSDGKLLVYSPQELLNGIVGIRFGAYSLGVTGEYVSHRFTLPLDPAESALPAYGIIGANGAGRWQVGPLELMAKLEGINLLNQAYQVVRNYPMPGRMFRINVELKYVSK